MSLVLALTLLVLACLIVVAVIVVAFLVWDRRSSLEAYLIAEHARMLDTSDALRSMHVEYAATLVNAHERDAHAWAAVIDALVVDRKYLVTAIVSMSHDPRAAQRLGLTTQATEPHPEPTRAEFMAEMMRETRGTEFVGPDGQVILPEGM